MYRHAVDADHIAAIDNVTRKLIQDGQRPLLVGLYFSLGHASVVCIMCCVHRIGLDKLIDFFFFSSCVLTISRSPWSLFRVIPTVEEPAM